MSVLPDSAAIVGQGLSRRFRKGGLASKSSICSGVGTLARTSVFA
jgi:hypothetical protein